MGIHFNMYYIVMCLCSLLSISFFTLMEQKFLALGQLRNGPYQVGYLGVLQPISDFVKLSIKESDDIFKDNISFLFLLHCWWHCPWMTFWSSVRLWLPPSWHSRGVKLESTPCRRPSPQHPESRTVLTS